MIKIKIGHKNFKEDMFELVTDVIGVGLISASLTTFNRNMIVFALGYIFVKLTFKDKEC